MRQLLLVFVVCFLVYSCGEDTTSNSSTSISGEIVNSNESFITLEKDGEFVDSVALSENGSFSYNFDENNFESGLYTFRHKPEGQTFFIEKGDSLLLRVNTKEFDESLMFTGNKAEENNFLIEMYLLNEKDNDLILSYYKVSPEKFAKKTDSIRSLRLDQLENLEDKYEFSESFLSLAEKNIDYEYYDLRERYAYLINKYFNEFRNKIPKEFFSYRKQVNFNDKDLQSLYTYQRFLDNYLKNRAIERCVAENPNKECFDTESITNLKNRLILSDSIFKIENLRNRFISRFAKRQLNSAKNEQQIDSSLQLVKSFDFPKNQYEELKQIGRLQKNYFVGKNTSNAKLYNTTGEKIILKDILDKQTITFTWSLYINNHPKFHKRVNELRNRYPEINFLGVNIDSDDKETYDLWLKALSNFDYNKDFEVKIRDRGNEIYLYKNFLNKILLIDENGIIKKSNLNLFDPNFEAELLEYLNQ